LEDAAKSNRIFKDWARSWSLRTIIQNAIRMIGPTPEQTPDRRLEKATLRAIDTRMEREAQSDASLIAILSLGPFERFVFVMSILERYSDQDCSILLACLRRDVALARTQAAEHIALFANPILPEATRGAGEFLQENLLPASA
jgi:hypothetical protein